MSQTTNINNLHIFVIDLSQVAPGGAEAAWEECAHRTEDLQHY